MATHPEQWSNTPTFLVALASRLEDLGQYNMAKLARAAADAHTRRAARQIHLPTSPAELAAIIEAWADSAESESVHAGLRSALAQGATGLASGRLAMFDDAPHPHVCRTCGYLTLQAPEPKCPECGAWPTTFLRFLPVYWLDALEPFDALARLRQTPQDVAELLEGLTEDKMQQRPPDGGWSIRNIVTHLRDANGVLSYRLALFVESESPSLSSQAVFAWAENDGESFSSTRGIFDVYLDSRREMIATLEGLPLAHWWRMGQHEEFGPMTLRQQVSYFASHEITHLPQIEALRRRMAVTG